MKHFLRFILVFYLLPQALLSQIYLSGNINENLILTSDTIYVISGSLNVSNGTTLTIEAGVILKFEMYTNLTIDGILDLQGTLESPVVFTSIRDDNYAGDTNGDGVASSPAPGNWGYVKITDDNNVIQNAVFRYGGYNQSRTLWVYGCSPTIANCEISYGNGYGIYWTGLDPFSSSGQILNNTISHGNGSGIFISNGSSSMLVSGNTITNQGGGIYIVIRQYPPEYLPFKLRDTS